MMAREAVNLSDRVILTSDNPRFENPNDILNDMLRASMPNSVVKLSLSSIAGKRFARLRSLPNRAMSF